MIHLDIHHPDLPASPGVVIRRSAAKAIVWQDEQLLMLRSRHGDYKFPGAGLKDHETAQQALARELREECRAHGAVVADQLVTVTERRPAVEDGAVFVMTSTYFRTYLDGCVRQVTSDEPGDLDEYERELRLTPVWVPLDAATTGNEQLLADWSPGQVGDRAPWLGRETAVLIELRTLLAPADSPRNSAGEDVTA